MRYTRLGNAKEAYADNLDDDMFGLSFEMTDPPNMTIVLDRPTLTRLQVQIAFALMPQQPPADLL